MTAKRFSFRRILDNNKIILVISFVLAVAIWLIISMQFSDPQEATFSDVPVTIDTTMSDSIDLQVFGQKDMRVSIQVSGKRYDVSPLTLSQDDFIVTASTVNVSSAGKHSLPITVRLKDTSRNVEIVSFRPESVDVYFDYSLTESYPIEVQLTAPDGGIAADGFVNGDPIASSAEVTVSGASTEINEIAKVLAKVKLDAPLEQTAKFENVSLSIVNANGGVIRSAYVKVEDSITDVTVTVPIFKIMQFKPSVRFKNTPSYFTDHPVSYICSPSGTVNAAVSTDLLDSAESLSLGTIDFADVKMGTNVFTFAAKDIPNIRVLDNVEEFRVYFSMDGFQSRTFTLTGEDISFTSVPRGVTASVAPDAQYTVTVVGLESEVQELTADRISAAVDAAGLSPQDEPYSLPVAFSIDGTTSCWVSGRASADVTAS